MTILLTLRSDIMSEHVSQETCCHQFVAAVSASCVSDILVEVEVNANSKPQALILMFRKC